MSVVVVATILPRPDYRTEVIEAIRQVIPQVHDEDGCELYALHEAPDRLIMVEKWASHAALTAHSGGPALAALGEALAGRVIAAPDVLVVQPVPAGDPAKGEL
jgi:quinol monooxygenase YgiN